MTRFFIFVNFVRKKKEKEKWLPCYPEGYTSCLKRCSDCSTKIKWFCFSFLLLMKAFSMLLAVQYSQTFCLFKLG